MGVDRAIEERRASVVKAAFEVFTSLGFARSQITAIADASHVSTATIYKLFDSKEALFRAAYEYGLDWLKSIELNDTSIADPADALRYVARRYADMLNSPVTRRIVRMQIAQNSTPAGDGRTEGRSMRALVEANFRGALQRAAATNLLDKDRLYQAHAMITGFIEHQTLTYGLIIDEETVGPFSGDELADEAVRVACLAYAPARVLA
jgi:AcrR family transcriptional regulator